MQIANTHSHSLAYIPGNGTSGYEPGNQLARRGGSALGRPGLGEAAQSAPAERVVQGEVLPDEHSGTHGERFGRGYFYAGFASRTPAQRAIDNYITTAQQSGLGALSRRLDVYA